MAMYVFVPPLLRLCYRYYNVVVLDASLVVQHLSYQSWYDCAFGYVRIRKMIHKFFFLFFPNNSNDLHIFRLIF